MESQKVYCRDESESDITGMVVMESAETRVRITENRPRGWCKPFWMPREEFHAKTTHDDHVDIVGFLSDEKFEQIERKSKA